MKIRIEAGNGVPERFKLFDMETGEKLGLVQEVNLQVSVKGSKLRFVTQVLDHNEKGTATYGPKILSPWLTGKFASDGNLYYFEGE
jgi:hypothetical protein